ncbi:MAG: acyl-CoA thioesterase [Spirochaetaceae bacterium]|jgi:acyl-CoA thioester hydrolase|nr:acyl-CoA thioesterase [Spirochaetaceae bacterium]
MDSISAEVEFSVEFYEVDSMEVVWHGNYVNYLERARRALLSRIGYGYRSMKESGFAFPVIDVSLKFIRPLRFGDRVRAMAVLDEYENRLRIKYKLFNAGTGELTTKGTSTQMAFDIAKNASCFACPRVLIEKVRGLLASGPAEQGPSNPEVNHPEEGVI